MRDERTCAVGCGWRSRSWRAEPAPPHNGHQRAAPEGSRGPGAWLTYGGDYGSQRHSPLTQITPANVDQLRSQWAFQTNALGKFESTPLVTERHHVLHRAEQHGVGRRCADRPQIWTLPPRAARRARSVLRPRQPRLRRARRPPLHEHARRTPAGPRHEDRRGRLGLGDRRLHAGLQRNARRRSSSRTRSSSASPAPSTASAASSTPTMPRPASAPGASGSSPRPATRAARRGKAIRGSAAAARPGSPAATTRR